MQVYTLTTPLAAVADSVSAPPVVVTSLIITGLAVNARPALAPIGTGTLAITLTDPSSGFQETVKTAFNPDAFWDGVTVATGQTVQDALHVALFGLLVTNKLLPAGTLAAA